VTVAFVVDQTPLIAGSDPFERFPKPGETSVGAPAISEQTIGQSPVRKLTSAVAAVAAALIPTPTPTQSSPQPSLPLILRGLWERTPATLANFENSGILRRLDTESIPGPPVDLVPLRAIPRGNAARALHAAADLSAWLGLTEEHIADIAGFSRRNYPNWRAGQGSYAKTVRGLFEIHALVNSLVQALGASDAMTWLSLRDTKGDPRQQLLATAEGRVQLLAEASKLLFAQAEHEQVVADFEDASEGASLAADAARSGALADAPPRRRRKPE
jgi:hypothetical protein